MRQERGSIEQALEKILAVKLTRRGFNQGLVFLGGRILSDAANLPLPRVMAGTSVDGEGERSRSFEDSDSGENLAQALECPIHYWHEIHSQGVFDHYLYNLLDSGYFPITLSTIAAYFETGEKGWPDDKKPMAITIDDGLLSQYKNAVPVLDKWKVVATFAVMPDWGGDGVHAYMNNDQKKDLTSYGEVADHTFNHPTNLPQLRLQNRGAWEAEIISSKYRLEDIIGMPVNGFVYPYGRFDQETVNLVASHFKIATKTGGGTSLKKEDLFTLPRLSRS